ncbi:MAG TPA: DUF1573 domain-containing protein [Flavisolibacter sp.]|jgi:hypothetical protein|nr:DUF1573 domain-containing protein [Flavisolibacter sp.]
MKKLLFIAAAFVVSISAMAQQKADDLIKMNTEKYDFGKIKQGVPVTTFFTITNTTDKPVVIENAWASCGCTTPEYSKEPIAPGGSTKLKVGYNAASMGTFTKPVYIKLAGINDPKQVNIIGEVVDANSVTATPAKATKAKKAS